MLQALVEKFSEASRAEVLIGKIYWSEFRSRNAKNPTGIVFSRASLSRSQC